MPVVQASPEMEAMDTSYDIVDANGIKLEFDQMDNKIIAATLRAVESGSLTPLIKEELRCTIQSRRLAEGKSEMKVEFKAPIKKKEMTDEERKRAQKRKLQNREAAQRFRQRQKDTSDHLTGKIKKLESSSKTLIDDLKRLRNEKELLVHMLNDHLLVCANPHLPHTPYQETQSHSSSLVSTCSSVNDYQSITDGIPDTAASDSSVFFADNDPKFANLEPAVVPTFGYESNTVEPPVCDEQYLEVGYEETVCNVDDTDSEFDEERRPDSCSSADTVGFKTGSCSVDWSCLSESMRSVTTAYSRAHLESCSSQAFDTLVDDYLLLDDVTP